MSEIKVKVSESLSLALQLSDEDFRQATGLTESQIQILRAVVEDCLGIDPAILSVNEIADRMGALK